METDFFQNNYPLHQIASVAYLKKYTQESAEMVGTTSKVGLVHTVQLFIGYFSIYK